MEEFMKGNLFKLEKKRVEDEKLLLYNNII